MSGKFPFVVHYRLHGQAHQVQVESASEAFTTSQARSHVEALHTSAKSADITDVSVVPSATQGPSKPGRKQAS